MTRYTDQQRADALALYVEHGLAETHRRTGIPRGTLSSWQQRAGVQTADPDGSRARARTAAARARWEELSEDRRQELAARLLAEAHILLDQVQEPTTYHHVVTLSGGKDEAARSEVVEVELPHPVAKDQRDRMQAVGIAVDRLQLLSGEATARLATDLGGLDLEAELRQQQARDAEVERLRAMLGEDG